MTSLHDVDLAAVPPSTHMKSFSKRKNCSPAAGTSLAANTSIPAKKVRIQPDGNLQDDDPVLTALLNIQSSLNEMDVRLQVLENRDRVLSNSTPEAVSAWTVSVFWGAELGKGE